MSELFVVVFPLEDAPSKEKDMKRSELIDLVSDARDAIDRGKPCDDIFVTLEKQLPGSDIRNLCHSDLPAETIVDVAFSDVRRRLSEPELLEVVRKLLAGPSTEAEGIALLELFIRNCRHPARSDLIYYPAPYFGGNADPSAGEIAALAIKGG